MSDMNPCPHEATVKHLAKDMWEGDRFHPGIADRMAEVERDMLYVKRWKEQVHIDLEGPPGNPEVGLINRINAFLNEQKASKEQKSVRQGREVLLVGVVAIAAPIAYDLLKHAMGVK